MKPELGHTRPLYFEDPVPPSSIQSYGEIVRLTVTQENLADENERDGFAAGWSAVVSNLKSFVETGNPLSRAPWEMPWLRQPAATTRRGPTGPPRTRR